MLHALELARSIQDTLAEALKTQFRLLEYAAATTAPDQAACAKFVAAAPGLQSRGNAAAAWVWASKARREPLQDFAKHGKARKKARWVRVRRQEAEEMLRGIPAALTPLPRDAPEWQKAGGKFLESFYDALGGAGIPGEMLGRDRNYTRHDFLEAFSNENKNLHVCAFCDEARIGTRRKGQLYADIDHFFPKSIYPHLSIHPYNLVPACHSCNSGVKGQTDPLFVDGQPRLAPAALALPYRCKGFAASTRLMVNLKVWRRGEPPFTLQGRRGGAPASQIDGLARTVQIPGRWNDPTTANEIGETAFRRLRQFVQARPEFADTRSESLLKKLDELLGLLRDENLGRDPLSLPIKWLLANIAQSAHDDPEGAEPLLIEIRAHLPTPRVHEEWERSGAELREILQEPDV